MTNLGSIQDLGNVLRKSWAALAMKPASLLVAVSGGLDSMILWRGLLEARAQDSTFPMIQALHMNFQLRGEESEGDAAFVLAQGVTWQCPVHVKVADLAQASRNTQSWARAERYAFFEAFADTLPQPVAIALAHHADDQAEGLLFRAMRGGSIATLAGMRRENARLWRPLLGTSRRDLQQLAQTHGIAYREDSSNHSDDYARNRLRHNVVPEMEAMHPGAARRLSGLAEDWQEWLIWANEILYGLGLKADADTLELSRLTHLPPSLQRHVLHGFVIDKAPEVFVALTREALNTWLTGATDQQWALSATRYLALTHGVFSVWENRDRSHPERFKQHALALSEAKSEFWLTAEIPLVIPLDHRHALEITQDVSGWIGLRFCVSNQSLMGSRVKLSSVKNREISDVEFPFTWDCVKVYKGGHELGEFRFDAKIVLPMPSVVPLDTRTSHSVRLQLIALDNV